MTCSSRGVGKTRENQRFNSGDQTAEVLPNNSPYLGRLDAGIVMRQAVPQRNEFRPWNPWVARPKLRGQLPGCLADNQERILRSLL